MNEGWREEKVRVGWKQEAWLEEGWWGEGGRKRNLSRSKNLTGKGGEGGKAGL